MSYEGYSQFLCKNGHYWKEDCYTVDAYGVKLCPICNESHVWENMVNTTNGSFDEDGKRIDGFIKLKQKVKTNGYCSACGKEHVCEERFEIPEEDEESICEYSGKKGYVPEEDCHCFCCGTHQPKENLCEKCGCNKDLHPITMGCQRVYQHSWDRRRFKSKKEDNN